MSSENAVQQKTNNKPGSRLKRAREDKGWSVSDTAEKLHVIPRYVRAIEEGEYDQLPGLVFLKGYIRSYARLVNLSEDRLIEDLEQELLMSSDPMMETGSAAVSPAGFEESKGGGKKVLLLGIVIVLAGVGYFAWEYFSQQQVTTPEASAPLEPEEVMEQDRTQLEGVDTETVTSTATSTDAASVSDNAPIVAEELITPEEPVPASEAVIDAQPTLEPSVETVTESSEPETPSVTLEEAVVQVPEPAEAVEEVTASSSVAESADSSSVTVKAVFTGDCWFDLRDRDNNRTVGLYRAGDVVDFSGAYPLRFVVGAVNAVSIDVNGKPLDFSQYRVRNNRVELVLEQ
ncbi:RodZ domain-containing protein [Hahella ganghwensis]|uniref:RodZ domain-containing protein n=1 Tax=Hahella ganghwensis TaxID=286420 RepID=UPI00035CF47D|nr:RodZ domain-containing protein [Hahella ganghwensis]